MFLINLINSILILITEIFRKSKNHQKNLLKKIQWISWSLKKITLEIKKKNINCVLN